MRYLKLVSCSAPTGPRGRNRQTRGWSCEGRMDPRGGYPAGDVSALLVRSHFGRAGRQGHAGRLEESFCRLVRDRAVAAAGFQGWTRSRYDGRRDRSGLQLAEFPRGICTRGAAGHPDSVLAQCGSVPQRLCDRKFHRRTGGGSQTRCSCLQESAARQVTSRQGGPRSRRRESRLGTSVAKGKRPRHLPAILVRQLHGARCRKTAPFGSAGSSVRSTAAR